MNVDSMGSIIKEFSVIDMDPSWVPGKDDKDLSEKFGNSVSRAIDAAKTGEMGTTRFYVKSNRTKQYHRLVVITEDTQVDIGVLERNVLSLQRKCTELKKKLDGCIGTQDYITAGQVQPLLERKQTELTDLQNDLESARKASNPMIVELEELIPKLEKEHTLLSNQIDFAVASCDYITAGNLEPDLRKKKEELNNAKSKLASLLKKPILLDTDIGEQKAMAISPYVPVDENPQITEDEISVQIDELTTPTHLSPPIDEKELDIEYQIDDMDKGWTPGMGDEDLSEKFSYSVTRAVKEVQSGSLTIPVFYIKSKTTLLYHKIQVFQNRSPYIMAPIVEYELKRDFSNTFYKKYYKPTKAPRTKKDVVEAIQEIIKWYCNKGGLQYEGGEGQEFVEDIVDSVQSEKLLTSELCVKLWTNGVKLNNREFCNILNEAIRIDDEDVIRSVLTVTMGIKCLLVTDRLNRSKVNWPEDNLSYRGSTLPVEHQSFYTPGTHYRVPMYLATSLQKRVAQGFLNILPSKSCPTLWYIHFPEEKCVHVNFIPQGVGCYADEEEFLFVPYSTFKVKKVDMKKKPTSRHPNEIHIMACSDNNNEPEDLPLAPWC